MMMKDPLGVKKKMPFAFALEELDALSPTIKQMFGGFAVYIGEKMILFLYDQEKWPDFRGVSLATTPSIIAAWRGNFLQRPRPSLRRSANAPGCLFRRARWILKSRC